MNVVAIANPIAAWADVVGGIGAALAVLVAIFVARVEARRASSAARDEAERSLLTLSANLIMELDNRLNSAELINKRVMAANYILKNNPDAISRAGFEAEYERLSLDDELIDDQGSLALSDLLAFFQMITNLVKRRALDEGSAANQFYLTMYMYWRFATELPEFKDDMNRHPQAYKDLQDLLDDFQKIDEGRSSGAARRAERDYVGYLLDELSRKIEKAMSKEQTSE